MNRKEISIVFSDKSLARIAGNPLGRETWEKIKDQVDWSSMNVFIFPDYLTSISSSFVQGFILEICERIGIENIYKNFAFHCDNPRVTKKIEDSINLTYSADRGISKNANI